MPLNSPGQGWQRFPTPPHCLQLIPHPLRCLCAMQYFYEEQLHRMECLSQESVSFTDVLAQMCDMLEPQVGTVLPHDCFRSKRAAMGTHRYKARLKGGVVGKGMALARLAVAAALAGTHVCLYRPN
jgi:hypothetical protein